MFLRGHFAVGLIAFSGWDGFLGTRGSFMLDTVFTAMILIVPWMALSIYLVRQRRYFALHKRMQLMMAALLLVAVMAFEFDMRIHGWRDRAVASPYWNEGSWNDAIDVSLGVHLLFAIPNLLLWTLVIVRALRHFPHPVRPNEHSVRHKFWAWWAVTLMTMTAVTGWLFYYLAFVAS